MLQPWDNDILITECFRLFSQSNKIFAGLTVSVHTSVFLISVSLFPFPKDHRLTNSSKLPHWPYNENYHWCHTSQDIVQGATSKAEQNKGCLHGNQSQYDDWAWTYPSRMFYKLVLHSSKLCSISALLCTPDCSILFDVELHLSILEDNTHEEVGIHIVSLAYMLQL